MFLILIILIVIVIVILIHVTLIINKIRNKLVVVIKILIYQRLNQQNLNNLHKYQLDPNNYQLNY